MSRLAVGLTQPPIRWVPGLNQPGQVDHSPLFSAQVKSEWRCTCPAVCLHGVDRDNFVFSFTGVTWLPVYGVLVFF